MDDFWIVEGSFSSLFMEILLVESRDFEWGELTIAQDFERDS